MLILFFTILSSFAGESVAIGPKYNCDAIYDSLRIPHVQIQTRSQFYYCFGYHHGKDRAWQMDYFRRVTEGRNAEVLGHSQLRSDLMMRLLDLPSVAERIYSELPEQSKSWLEDYSAGVNQGFTTGKNSPEISWELTPWLPVDSIKVMLLQSFDQTRKTFTRDIDEEKFKEHWKDKASSLFDHDDVPWENTILKEGEYLKGAHSAQMTPSHRELKLWSGFPAVFGEESGSNNWVVSAKKSKGNFAILANDPHLDLKTPLFWYWINLKGPDSNLIGASLPGLPVVASGTNGKLAWGLTNAYLNTADAVYLKHLGPHEIKTIRPTVWVKIGPVKVPFFFKSFEKLKSGHPILPLEVDEDLPVALRWVGFGLTGKDIAAMFDIHLSNNVDEIDEVIKSTQVPAWNFVFADTKGDIGYRVMGKSYLLNEKTSFGLPQMTLEEFLNERYLPTEQRPGVIRPKRQYVYTANNRHWPKDAQFYGGRAYAESFRGYRIDELMRGQHDFESFREIQCDVQVTDARFFLPKLLKYVPDPKLQAWDLMAKDSSIALPIYRRLMDRLMDEWNVNEYALFRLLDSLDEKQIAELKEQYELSLSDINGRNWGDLHFLKFPHMSQNADWKYSPQMPGEGDIHTVNPGTSKWDDSLNHYEHTAGSSMRMIIEMKSKPVVHLVLPGLNRMYSDKGDSDPWKDWKECKYSTLEF